ncbi:biotin transporter BioY [Tessaracoccus sp. MC1865]|uniref:biotin transporter BioY n=1 Tax=Tessaracoccus sp. MC1865 TaxID=2760310 RepID=UPI001603B9AC|nr:biotin transporter BioY [Tessaracoccus sp. MC1865]MBB1483569.1 biotin transporter BioY [Tessaracoccus sp. MC1865]QTO36654.1 biotin transporter BioY [Tessaracoccus sp. MC1865]
MSTSTAVDAPRTKAFAPADLAYIAVFAALLSALSQITVSLGPVPFTLQTLGVALTALVLGPWRGSAAVVLYIVVGVAGLPVFAGGKAGLSAFLGATGGYLISFVVAAVLIGFVAKWALRKGLSPMTPVWFFVGCLAARYLVILPIGVGWLSGYLDKPFFDAMVTIDMPFWIWDAAKSLFAVLIAVAVHKAFPRLLGR